MKKSTTAFSSPSSSVRPGRAAAVPSSSSPELLRGNSSVTIRLALTVSTLGAPKIDGDALGAPGSASRRLPVPPPIDPATEGVLAKPPEPNEKPPPDDDGVGLLSAPLTLGLGGLVSPHSSHVAAPRHGSRWYSSDPTSPLGIRYQIDSLASKNGYARTAAPSYNTSSSLAARTTVSSVGPSSSSMLDTAPFPAAAAVMDDGAYSSVFSETVTYTAYRVSESSLMGTSNRGSSKGRGSFLAPLLGGTVTFPAATLL